MFYASTYSWGLPSGDTWTLFHAEIDLVREQFHVAVAPVLDGGGWPVLAAIGMAFAVSLSDAFAFGALARAEALVPGGVLFVFIAALGADRLRVELSVALVAAGVVATVVLRAHHAPGGIRAGHTARRVVWQAAATAVVVGLLAGYVGQRLPGAEAEALFDTRGNGDGYGAELSPFVDIRSRLTNQKAVELLVVTTSAPSYWRLTTYPEFDGRTWHAADRKIGRPDIDLAAARSTAQEVRQHVHIVGLGGEFVPAAPDPTAAGGPDGDKVPFDWGTSTLTWVEEFSNGDDFDVVSASPRFDAATLNAATSTYAGDPIYVELPYDFPAVAAQTAQDVTAAAGASTSYEKAIALQNWFRSNFEYSLQVQPGHGNAAIEGFLRDRVGYCEQFAGTYAAMMRSLGIPARVAVGFTTGDPIGGGQYTVAGRNAHAWPEVWFDDIGWVLFEPTPGRGAPGAESYTDVPAAQATAANDPAPPADADVADDAAPSTTAPIISDGAGPVVDDGPAEPAPLEPAPTPEPDSWPYGKWVVLALALAAVAPVVVRRVRRRAVGRTNDEKLALLWARSQRSLRDVDVRLNRWETPNEFAERAAMAFPVVSRPVKSLAEALTEATYRPEGSAGFDVPGSVRFEPTS